MEYNADLNPSLPSKKPKKIISFEASIGSISRGQNWRAALGYKEDLELWQAAYNRVEALLTDCPSALKKVVFPFFHYLAEVYQVALAINHFEAKPADTSFVVPKNYFESPSSFSFLQNSVKTGEWKKIVRRLNSDNVQRLFQKPLHFLARARARKLKRLKRPVWLVVIEDSGSSVNVMPGLKVINEMSERGISPLVLTSSSYVRDYLKPHGHNVEFIQPDVSYQIPSVLLTEFDLWKTNKTQTASDSYFFNQTKSRLFFMAGLGKSCADRVSAFEKSISFEGLFSVNETTSLSIICSQILSNEVPWIGFFPILLGNRPDCNFFPAKHHLVYGDQLKDLMLRNGVAAASIDVVGTPTYDSALKRSSTDDRKYVRELLGRKLDDNKKLVVVATEAFADAETEMVPVLTELSKLNELQIILKVHPSDELGLFQNLVNKICGSSITVVKEADIDALLNSADLLICIVSNIIIRAAQLGTPTLVCDFSDKRKSVDFVEAGLAYGCFHENEIVAQILNTVHLKRQNSQILKAKLKSGLTQFNGANDGQSHKRIVDCLFQKIDATRSSFQKNNVFKTRDGKLSSSDLQKLRSKQKSLPNSVVIDFVGFKDEYLDITPWQAAFSYDEYNQTWKAGYKLFWKTYSLLCEDLQKVVYPFFHEMSDITTKWLSYKKLVDAQHPNHLIVVSETLIRAETFTENTALRRKIFLFFHLESVLTAETITGKILALAWLIVKIPLIIFLFVSRAVGLFWRLRHDLFLSTRGIHAIISLLQFRLTGGETNIFSAPTPIIRSRYRLPATSIMKRKLSATVSPILLTVEDSGSMVNLGPTIKIIEELNRRKEEFIVYTSNELVEKHLEGVAKVFRIFPSIIHHIYSRIYLMRRFNEKLLSLVKITPSKECLAVLSLLQKRLPDYVTWRLSFYCTHRVINSLVSFKKIFSVNETLPLAMMVGERLFDKNLQWIGFYPILLGDRADCEFFPADHTLAYGKQLTDLMVSHGRSKDSIFEVGTPMYDSACNRDIEKDTAIVQTLFPYDPKKKLIVVPTECFSDPLIELGPIFKTLSDLESIQVAVKIHPSDDPEFFRKHIQSLPRNTHIYVIEKCDVDALMNVADLMICIISNLIIRATLLGTPNVIFDFSGKSKILDFAKEGISFACYDPHKIRETILELLYDSSMKAKIEEKLSAGINRFCTSGDGMSHKRIVDFVVN